ncbi:RNA-directed DNA polymerase from mobile element jockey [Portunus trituberculatus]|uniref:RNA-directed DNA polymerase from mobile element jockey n=1 Tax=Portunus trituberculatus TaxID=210409 RepID=A0A5B7GI68_PORTR|nr:RNA-directed DNA polymerase from mobile element jockey [Portunus trituberculatus]
MALTQVARVQTLHLLVKNGIRIEQDSILVELRGNVKQCRPTFNVRSVKFQAYSRNTSLCVTLQHYLARTEELRQGFSQEDDELFLSYVRPHKSVTKDTIARWVKAMLQRSGVDTTKFTTGSVRSAAVSKVKAMKIVHLQAPLTFPLTSNNVLLTTDAQNAVCLATHIHTTFSSPDPVPTPVLPSSSHSSHDISTAITPQELTSTLHSLSIWKATGPDDVLNKFLRCLPDALLQLLLDILNNSWLSGTFPSVWRLAIIFPFPKPGKNLMIASSYRPISLPSNISKVFEHVIQNRLTWWLERKHLLPPNVFSFQPQRGILDALLLLEYHIQEGFSHKKLTLVAFLELNPFVPDVQKARLYDIRVVVPRA